MLGIVLAFDSKDEQPQNSSLVYQVHTSQDKDY